MADEVETTGYARIVRRGLEVWGIKADSTETLLYSGTFLGSTLEVADNLAWVNGVTFETEVVETEES